MEISNNPSIEALPLLYITLHHRRDAADFSLDVHSRDMPVSLIYLHGFLKSTHAIHALVLYLCGFISDTLC